ncbi:MAG: hypothetical protein ACK5PS_19840 [Desulfopila sp.]
MAHPVVCLSLLTATPLGWAVLGTAGYLTYRAGKHIGKTGDENVAREPLCDRAIKSAMKSAYKTKVKMDETIDSAKVKYGAMWQDAQAEVAAKKGNRA